MPRLGNRPILRQMVAPIGVFVVIVVTGILGYAMLGNVGLVEAAFWMIDPTSIDLHFEAHAGPERATKAYAVVVTVGLVLSGLWIGETVVTELFGDGFPRRYHEQRCNDESETATITLSSVATACSDGRSQTGSPRRAERSSSSR